MLVAFKANTEQIKDEKLEHSDVAIEKEKAVNNSNIAPWRTSGTVAGTRSNNNSPSLNLLSIEGIF